MAIGRISGSVLKSNLTRNGVDLAFETNLLYLDVTNSRVGIGTSEPSTALQVSGTVTATSVTSTSAATLATGTTIGNLTLANGSITDSSGAISFGNENLTTTGTFTASGLTFPSSDGSNGQVLTTDGSGTLSFSESSGGGGGNNTAIKQKNYYKLDTTSAVIDEFDINEYRGAIYDITMEDQDNGFVGHIKVSIVHDGSTPYVAEYNVNEDSTRIADFSVAISGDMLQLSAATNSSNHTNLRIYRIALGDHHETVANTNSKIIVTSSNIGSSATTLDQFTKTDIRGAKYVILIKDDTAGDYQISETSVVHDGTTVYHDDYALVSSRGTPLHTISAAISGSTVTLSSASGGNTTGTAILYRQDLGSKTKFGTFDNVLYGLKGDIDSTVETVDTFDAFEFKSARYFITMESGSEYQNSEVTLTVNNAGTDATISESFVISGNNQLAAFTADVSSGKARLRASCNPNTKIFFARLSIEAKNVYRASGQTSDNLYISHNNIDATDTLLNLSGMTGALTLPKGTTGQRPSGVTGMLRYNTTTDTYERFDSSTSTFVDIATQASVSESDDTSTGESTSIGTSAKNIDTFATSAFDSAFYLAVMRDEINDELATANISVVHNNSDAFVSPGGGVQQGSNAQLTFTADVNSGSVRLRGTGTAAVNSIKFFRIGLGDNTSASSSGNTATVLNSDVDSTAENLDTFAKGTYRGAKYYISANNTGKTELHNIECLVVHNGTDAFITTYASNFTGNNALISLTADISGSDVRLRATANESNTAVKMYRVLLGDAESDASSTNTKTVGQTTTSSSATTMDTFSTDSANGAFYIVVGNSSSESAASISEVFVVSDGTDAFVATGPQVSTKGTSQLTFTAALSGSTVTVSSASTSGASTTVNAYRVNLLRSLAGASTDITVLTNTAQTISGDKTFTDGTEIKFGTDADANIKHTGTNLNIQETTGDINIRTYADNKDVVIASDDSSGGLANYIIADGSTGEVKLHHYGTEVFATTSTGVAITNTSTSDALLITTTEDSSTAGPVITLKRNSSSPADGDYLGQIKFLGENDNDQEITYAKISGKILDASDGDEDGIIEFMNKKSGGNTITARLRSDSFQLLNDTTLRVANITYPTADGTNGQVIKTDGAGTLSFTDLTSGAAGSNQQVQFNNSGSLGGSSNLTFDGTTLTTNTLRVTGNITVDGTETILNTTTLSVEDNIIELNRNVSSNSGTPTISGIRVNRGEGSTATEQALYFAWDETFVDDGTSIHGGAGGAWTAFKAPRGDESGPGESNLVDIRANVVHALSTSAQYADLAEKYENDKEYPVGTLMMVGGDKETTEWKDGNVCIGVISDNPAYLMNKSANGQAHAIRGKVPVRCIGKVLKGSKLYGYGDGTASIQGKEFIGVALETSNNSKEKLVQCILKI